MKTLVRSLTVLLIIFLMTSSCAHRDLRMEQLASLKPQRPQMLPVVWTEIEKDGVIYYALDIENARNLTINQMRLKAYIEQLETVFETK